MPLFSNGWRFTVAENAEKFSGPCGRRRPEDAFYRSEGGLSSIGYKNEIHSYDSHEINDFVKLIFASCV